MHRPMVEPVIEASYSKVVTSKVQRDVLEKSATYEVRFVKGGIE
jgi:hypothetical protein